MLRTSGPATYEHHHFVKHDFFTSAFRVIVVAALILLVLKAYGVAQPQRDNAPVQISDMPQDTLSAIYHMKIRDLQFQQDKLIMKLQTLRLEEATVQKQIDDFTDKINEAAYKAAVEERMDVQKFSLDLDHLYWIKKGEHK